MGSRCVRVAFGGRCVCCVDSVGRSEDSIADVGENYAATRDRPGMSWPMRGGARIIARV